MQAAQPDAHEALRQTLAEGLAKVGVQLVTWRTDPEGIDLSYQTARHHRRMRIVMKPVVEKLQDQTQISLVLGELVLNHAGIYMGENAPICCAWCSEPLGEDDETTTLVQVTPRGPEVLPIHPHCAELRERVISTLGEPPQCAPCFAPLQERPPNPERKPAPGLMYCSRCGGPYRV
jgi:hypothetical protein